MLKELDDSNWYEAFGESGTYNFIGAPEVEPPGASVSTDPVLREDVVEIIAMDDGARDEYDWVGLFKLKDGRYATVEGGCDYTGWDCQSSTKVSVSASVEDAIMFGLSSDARTRLKLDKKVK